MTAINALASGPVGLIVSDTACYDAAGVVQAFMSKVIALPRIRTAIALRGPMAALPFFACDLDFGCDSFDDVIERGPRLMEITFNANMMAWADRSFDPELEITVVGWSEKQRRCRALGIQSHDGGDREPFTWFEQSVIFSPDPSMEQLREAGVIAANGGFDDADVAGSMLKLIKLQRTLKNPMRGSGARAHIVGGDVMFTEVGEHGVVQRIVHRWQDRIGDLITAAPPSREQQRRLAQQARKLARAS